MTKAGKKYIIWISITVVFLVSLLVIARLWSGTLPAAVYVGGTETESLIVPPAGFKVAIMADQGLGIGAWKVLKLIKDEGADMIIVSGDLGYNESNAGAPELWDKMINVALGADYPLFISQGNHDVDQWDQYKVLAEARLARIPEATCAGEMGTKTACSYKGLFFLLTAEGTEDIYYEDQLAQSDSLWKICSWHKNQRAMQMGSKLDDIGWGPYEECREAGAIIVSGHEHSYSRTKTLTDMSRQTVDSLWSDPNVLRVGKGSSFVAVSGLGGNSIRGQGRCLPATYPYGCNEEWASIYTTEQGAKPGVLFLEFNVDGDERKANGYFKNVDNETIDTFTVTADLDGTAAATADEVISEGSSWKYLDDGSDQGEAWREFSFDDSSWSSGLAQLGYGDGDEATVISYGADSNKKNTTTYFRNTFYVTQAESLFAASLTLLSDDGGVVYLNGEEVFRKNMPLDDVTSTTFASNPIGGADESLFDRRAIPVDLLREGENVIAVEIHQATFNSSDVSFDFTFDVTRKVMVVTPTPSPTSEITSAEMVFQNTKYYVHPGDTVEIPIRVTVRGRGIMDIISRAIFKISDMTSTLSSFLPVFE